MIKHTNLLGFDAKSLYYANGCPDEYKVKKTRCVMVNEISNFGQGLYPPALWESWVKAWTPP